MSESNRGDDWPRAAKSEPNPNPLEQAAAILRECDGLLITAGAGMGVDSGLPDFRGNTGFWQAYPALAKSGYEFTSVASPRTFEKDPHLAWGFYGHRLNLYRNTVPNEGFDILKRWGDKLPKGWFVVTSNVDGQFQKAGYDPQRIYELHGSLHRLQCSKPCSGDTWSADGFNPQTDDEACQLVSALPQCPKCRRLARPNVLMFGDWEWNDSDTYVQRKCFAHWVERVERLAIVEIGAGTAIQAVRMVSETQGNKSRLIRINPREPDIPLGVKGVGLAMTGVQGVRGIELMLS